MLQLPNFLNGVNSIENTLRGDLVDKYFYNYYDTIDPNKKFYEHMKESNLVLKKLLKKQLNETT